MKATSPPNFNIEKILGGIDMEGIKLSGVGMITAPVINSVEIDKLTDVNGVNAPENKLNVSDNASEELGEPSETDMKAETKKAKKHIVTYVAGGNWIDQSGKAWARTPVKGTNITNIREYDDSEFVGREDIKFMIGYGSMTVTTVEL